ncbi:MAG TPA: hypothetical protein VIC85_17195, partial [Ktedonobacterales bacterium]
MLAWFAVVALAMFPPCQRALADGGAPNLLYIVDEGSLSGLTIVDIARKQVVGHVSIGGNPQSV